LFEFSIEVVEFCLDRGSAEFFLFGFELGEKAAVFSGLLVAVVACGCEFVFDLSDSSLEVLELFLIFGDLRDGLGDALHLEEGFVLFLEGVAGVFESKVLLFIGLAQLGDSLFVFSDLVLELIDFGLVFGVSLEDGGDI